MESLSEFNRFRSGLREHARKALEKAEPDYAKKFVAESEKTGDFQRADAVARGSLKKGLPSKWAELLRLTLDFELALDGTKRALQLMGTPPPQREDWSTGAWLAYNLNHWTFQTDAWLEKLDTLVAKACRGLIRNETAYGKKVERELRVVVKAMKSTMAKTRDPLAHTGAGGFTEAIGNENLWEPGLIMGFDEDLAPHFYNDIGRYQATWHDRLSKNTAIAVANSEKLFRKLNQHCSWRGTITSQ